MCICIHYFEQYNEGNPVSQLQSSDLTRACFSLENGLLTGELLAVLPSALPCTVVTNFPQAKSWQVWVAASQHLTSNGFSKLFCTFFSNVSKLSLYIWIRICRCVRLWFRGRPSQTVCQSPMMIPTYYIWLPFGSSHCSPALWRGKSLWVVLRLLPTILLEPQVQR